MVSVGGAHSKIGRATMWLAVAGEGSRRIRKGDLVPDSSGEHHFIEVIYKSVHCPCPSPTIDYLASLHVHQISVFRTKIYSYIHDSPDHSVSPDPQALFTKIICNARGRGGYCLGGSSILFNHVLRALGFQVYAAGVRIRARSSHDGVPRGDYIGWYKADIDVTILSSFEQGHTPSPTRSLIHPQ